MKKRFLDNPILLRADSGLVDAYQIVSQNELYPVQQLQHITFASRT